MKQILKIGATLIALFSLSFLLNLHFQWITVSGIERQIEQLQARDDFALTAFLIIVGLLAVDIFLAIPAFTTSLLAGYFLGPWLGAAAAFTGLTAAMSIGYWLSRSGSDRLLRHIVPPSEISKIQLWFDKYGALVLVTGRMIPMVPETTACLAGLSRMHIGRFYFAVVLANLPYALAAAYAGSISSLAKPWPALITGFVLSVLSWSAWMYFRPNANAKSLPESHPNRDLVGASNEN